MKLAKLYTLGRSGSIKKLRKELCGGRQTHDGKIGE